MKRTMLIAALAAILCCAALPGMAQDYSEYWFNLQLADGAAYAPLDGKGVFGYEQKELGTLAVTGKTVDSGAYAADGLKLFDYEGTLQFWSPEEKPELLWEGKFAYPAEKNKFFFTFAVVDGADDATIPVGAVKAAGVELFGKEYGRTAKMNIDQTGGVWKAPSVAGFACEDTRWSGELTGYFELAAAPPPSIPEPVFFQFGAMMGLSGLGILRLRRKA